MHACPDTINYHKFLLLFKLSNYVSKLSNYVSKLSNYVSNNNNEFVSFMT